MVVCDLIKSVVEPIQGMFWRTQREKLLRLWDAALPPGIAGCSLLEVGFDRRVINNNSFSSFKSSQELDTATYVTKQVPPP